MSFPLVPLDSIPNQGLSVTIGDWALAACGEGLGGAAAGVSGALSLTRNARRIAVAGEVAGKATVPCDRCGEPLALAVEGAVDCTYLPVDELASTPVDEPEPEEAPDEGEYDGVALDLRHVVAEFFALERPARFRCADLDPASDEACRARFRARANVGAPEPDPRLSALKGVKPTR